MTDGTRTQIQAMIAAGDLQGLLAKAGEIHGHLCGYVTYGLLAGYDGLKRLGGRNTGMEEVLAIVETNSCFSDGVQVVTGCTFGNNALIYRDLGKTAVSVIDRQGRGTRYCLRPEHAETAMDARPGARALFDKLVTRREPPASGEQGQLFQFFREAALAGLEEPIDQVFRVEEVQTAVPAYAPIFATVRCAACGESLMEAKAVNRGERTLCRACTGEEYFELNGAGICRVQSPASP